MSDPVVEALEALRERLVMSANRRGHGPATARKSSFVSEIERQSFIEAFGQKAYDDLEP